MEFYVGPLALTLYICRVGSDKCAIIETFVV